MPAQGYIDNAELERAIREGDREALGVALLTLAGRVVGRWSHWLPPGADADDVVQDAVIATLRRLERYDPSKGRAFAYATESVKLTVREAGRAAARRAAKYRPLAAAGVE